MDPVAPHLVLPEDIDRWLARREAAAPPADPMGFALSLVDDASEFAWGGPFGAAAFDQDGNVLACGVNLVLATGNPLLHAEVTCLHRLFGRAATREFDPRTVTIVSTSEPCAMCAGAINWARPTTLVYGATRDDVESIGFDEGPKAGDWCEHLERGGITVTAGTGREAARAQLLRYAAENRELY